MEVTENEEVVIDKEVENKAKGMGWQPLDNFKGDPEKHISAEEFVKRGKDYVPFLRKDNANLKAEVQALRNDLAQTKEAVKIYGDNIKQSSKEKYAKKVEDFNILLKQKDDQLQLALQNEDGNAISQISREMAVMEKPTEKPPIVPEITETQTTVEDPRFSSWKEKNPWYNQTNPNPATIMADQLSYKLVHEDKVDPDRVLEIVEQKAREHYPEHFESVNAVDGGGRDASPVTTRRAGKKPTTKKELSPEFQAGCDMAIANGFVKDEKEYIAQMDF